MSNTIYKLSERTTKETVRYGRRSSRSRVRIILPVLVLAVAITSLTAWLGDGFSVETRAFRGEAAAQYLLGKSYFDQGTSPRDYARAGHWIRKAADQGYAKAETGLGLMYENGLGVPRNYSEALKWLRRAADQGFAIAQNELAVMYAKGRGVPRDLNEAAKWSHQAAAQGSEVAKGNLKLIEAAKSNAIPQLTTRTKDSYQHVTLQKVESDGVTFAFQPIKGGLGLAKMKLENLPGSLQELCGYIAKGKSNSSSGSPYSQLDSVSSAL